MPSPKCTFRLTARAAPPVGRRRRAGSRSLARGRLRSPSQARDDGVVDPRFLPPVTCPRASTRGASRTGSPRRGQGPSMRAASSSRTRRDDADERLRDREQPVVVVGAGAARPGGAERVERDDAVGGGDAEHRRRQALGIRLPACPVERGDRIRSCAGLVPARRVACARRDRAASRAMPDDQPVRTRLHEHVAERRRLDRARRARADPSGRPCAGRAAR